MSNPATPTVRVRITEKQGDLVLVSTATVPLEEALAMLAPLGEPSMVSGGRRTWRYQDARITLIA